MKAARNQKILLFFLFAISTQKLIPAQVPWQTDWESAKQSAISGNKPILILFSGSDWCKPCILFEREVLSSDSFAGFLALQTIPFRADFPRKAKNKLSSVLQQQNESLARQMNPDGIFPRAFLISPNGNQAIELRLEEQDTNSFQQQIETAKESNGW